MFISTPPTTRRDNLTARLENPSTQDSALCSSSTSNGSCVSETSFTPQVRTAQVFSTSNPAAMIVLGFAIFLITLAAIFCIYKKSKLLKGCFRRRSKAEDVEAQPASLLVSTRMPGEGLEGMRVVEVEPATPSTLLGERTPTSFLGDDGRDEKKGLDTLEKGAVPVDILSHDNGLPAASRKSITLRLS